MGDWKRSLTGVPCTRTRPGRSRMTPVDGACVGASVGAVRVDGGGVSITSYEGLSFGASAGAWPSETVGELVMTSKVRAIETRMDRFDGP